jgi:flagellar protein FlbD
MITLTHFGSGTRIALNCDLIEKVEETPDTVITLTNGTRYLVQETLDQIVDKTVEVRARALHLAQKMELQTAPGSGRLRLVRGIGDPHHEDDGGDEGDDTRPEGGLR